MSDLISRQAAIDAITDECIVNNMDSVRDTELHRCKRATHRILANLPSVDPVKHGEWVWQDSPVFGNPYGSYMCPLCQNTMPHKTNYCPNCGAKMEGVKNEQQK